MKVILTFINTLAFFASLQAQPDNPCPASKNAVKYFNGFQHTKADPAKTTQALFYAQSLAKECPYTLQSLLHTFFAQSFIKGYTEKYNNANERKLLDLFINDTTQVLVQTAKPIYLWVQVQENENNPDELIKLANAFVETQFSTPEIYGNRTARYALLIYGLLQNKRECSQIAQVLFDKTSTSLNNTIHTYDLPGDAAHNRKRAWYRYMYAYIHFVQAERAKNKGDLENAERFYRTAANYSPDATDKQLTSAYEYEGVFLQDTTAGDGYKEVYVNFLATSSDKHRSLQALTALAIEKPANISRLRAFYTKHYSAKEPFDTYWERELNKERKPAPEFNVIQLNNQAFSLKEHKGKWVLVDFWGTWCAPCIEEMPKMQSFYRVVAAKHADKLSVITIACKDTEIKVKTFLNKRAYNFPVAMADASIEKEYEVAAYPTKILITPQGNILPISSGREWLEQVKLYCQLP